MHFWKNWNEWNSNPRANIEIVFHHGEPCTLRWTKNIIFAKNEGMA